MIIKVHVCCLNISCILHTTYTIGTTGYYDNGGAPAPVNEWENRKIFGLIWENRRGWRVETKLCNDLVGASANYYINPTLITMITESRRNKQVQFRSRMWFVYQLCNIFRIEHIIIIFCIKNNTTIFNFKGMILYTYISIICIIWYELVVSSG